MFEKVARRTAHIVYWLAIALGVVVLATLCLTHLPWWAAALAFCLALPLLAWAAAPLAALAALLAGLVAAIAAVAARQARHGG